MSSTITKSTRTVYAFRAVRTEEGFDPSQDFVVCPWGTFQTRKGPVTVNEKTLRVFEANQKAARRDKVAGDFNHNTLRGQEPVKVAGWFTPRVVRDQGIVVRMTSETPEMQLVRDKHYPDISPAVERDDHGVVESLHSFAFVRHGEIDHPDLEIFSVELSGAEPTQPMKTTPMSDSDMLSQLLTALTGETIAADATPEAKLAALAKAKGGKTTSPAAPETSAMSAELTKALAPILTQVQGLVTKVDGFAAEQAKSHIDGLITAATQAGKKIGLKPERIVAMGAEGAKEYLDSLEPGVVKVNGQNNNNVKGASAGGKSGDKPTDVFNAESLAMLKRNGFDPAKMVEQNKAGLTILSAEAAADAEEDPEPETAGKPAAGAAAPAAS